MYHHNEDVTCVMDALVELTGYDSFAERDLEVYMAVTMSIMCMMA